MKIKKSIIAMTVLLLYLSCTSSPDASYVDDSLAVDVRVENLLSRMTLDEKLGQMTQVNFQDLLSESDIKKYKLGSLLSGGGGSPPINNPQSWADMYDRFQSQALSTRLGIPLIYGVDAVHGHNNVKGATIFPHNIGLGAAGDPDLVREISRITALEVAGTGIDWTFSPCIAVPRNEKWGRTYEGFSEDPELVNTLGRASIQGYQGTDLSDPETIMATAKHYVADGGTEGGRDQGNAVMNEQELRDIHLLPYLGAIDEKVGSIMASFSSWNGEKIHGSEYLLNDILRSELQFQGFVISDWAGVKQLPGNYDEQIIKAINAGIDMVMLPDDYIPFLASLKKSVQSGKITMERIDSAVSRILKAKFELGLFENPYTDRSYTDLIGSQAHREVAREAVRKSLVLLKNDDSLLPLSKNVTSILVAGGNANNLGSQSGGWTISWQGERGNGFTEGTTIFEAIEETVSDGVEVEYSLSGKTVDGTEDVAIVVIGESAYAEYRGDRGSLDILERDLNAIKTIKEKGVKIVTILISGRPMIINEVLKLSDAFIAAWLPGTEGLGVADVLFGDYSPTGKLPHTWPASMDQIPINRQSPHKESALFPFGFGLGYTK